MSKVEPKIFKELNRYIKKEEKKLSSIMRTFLDMQEKIYKRCMLEGCVYGYPQLNEKPLDKCMYCNTPNIARQANPSFFINNKG